MTKMSNATKRILAAVLTMLLVFGMVPVSAIPVSAATTDYPEAVTVTVKDGNSNPVSGAEVSFTITDSTDAEVKKDTVTTNTNGSAEVLAKADYKDGLTINATVTKDGYASATISKVIASADENLEATIKANEITGIAVVPLDTQCKPDTQTGKAKLYDAVTVQGTMDGDEVFYQIDGSEATTEVPQISKPGKYNVMVTVKRAGYVDFVKEVEAEIVGITLTAKTTESEFTGKPQELLKETNFTGLVKYYGYSFDFYIGDEKTATIPEKTDVGEYKVRVVGKSSFEGLSEIDKTFTATIVPAPLNADVVTITPYNGKYDGSSHAAVEVKPADGKTLNKVEYSEDDGTTWTQTVPVIKEADTYPVKVRVELTDKNYVATEYEVTAMITAGDRDFSFAVAAFNAETSKSNAEVVAKNGEEITINKSYNFEAMAEEQTKEETVKYKVESADGEATINEKGLLTVTKPGTFKVTATIAETKNYAEKEISHEINVRAVPKDKEGNRVAFVDFGEIAEVNYYVNKNSNVISDAKAEPTVNDNSNITYKISPAEADTYFAGIACDATTGKVYITDIDAFISYLNRAGGLLKVKVEATKSEGTLTIGDKDSYIINIQYPYVNESLFTLAMSLTGAGWINSEVTVNPKEGYTIAKARSYGQDTTIISHEKIEAADDAEQIKTALDNAFTSSVKFGDDGQNKRSVYLCDKEGYIYAPVDVKMNINGIEQDLKVDRTAPTGLIIKEYSTELNSIGDAIKTLFYKDVVTVTFEATDEMSGIQNFTCEYNGKDVPIAREDISYSNNGKTATATATITIEKGEEYKSKVSFKAYDRAGNVTKKTGDETVIIDYISPEMSVEYVNPVNIVPDSEATPKTYYFNESNNLVYKVKVKETNGFEENGKITVLKDGQKFDGATVEYKRINGEDVYTVTVPSTVENQGVYTVKASYKDKSENVMMVGDTEVDVFVSDEMVIDTTAASIEFAYAENAKHDNSKDACEDYTITLTVTEVNFDPADFVATVEAKDIKENDVSVDKLNNYIKDIDHWTSDGDKHVCVLTYGKDGVLPDANYGNIKFEYTDLAKNASATDSGEFIIDTTAPTAPVITYEDSLWPVIAEVLTLGLGDEIVYKFFNAPTTITLTSTDATWGVDSFVLEYNRQEGASETNAEKIYIDTNNYDDIEVKQSETDKDMFTAEITLPKNEADQLRGNVSAHAVDKHGIKSETVTDEGTVIVVDDIAPEVSVSYSNAQRTEITTNKAYYNTDIKATITVKEVNFYAEDVVLSVIKDGVEIAAPTIEWAQAKGENDEAILDTYKGTFTLPALADHSADGDYIVKLSYTDRSTNKAEAYESNVLVIDTTAPVINVVYSNTTPVNTLEDIKGITRNYFGETQVATITITEHNFSDKEDKEVVLDILEQDVSGDPVAQTREESGWTTVGDVHTMTITYHGDANYTFDIAYTDLATNEAEDYTPDYFTVDDTAPELTVEQINKVATTFINNISFGYFGGAKDKNAKAEIKVTVKDNISFANVVTATYNQTDGTSSVNKETETQTANADKITLSKDGKTATTTFWLPVTALKTDKNNMHGDVTFIALDRAGKSSDDNENSKNVTGVIVDNISPKATIEYSKPYTTANKISYYDGKITGKITVVEANFDNPEKFYLYYSKDGGKKTRIPLEWTDESVNVHTATFTLSQDGDYILTATYTDKATNKMADYKSNQLTIDTKINAPVITFNGVASNGDSFSGDFTAGFKFEDDNYKSYQVTLTRTRYDEKNIDVKGEFIGNRVAINANGGSGSFKIPEERVNDGVYTLTVKMTDMLDHSSTTSRTFVVNRFGSVYVYNDALIEYISKGYIQSVDEDIIITEYNPNKLKDGSVDIFVKNEGDEVKDAITTTSPEQNNGWYEYKHIISKETFYEQGHYTITLSSNDDAGNKNPAEDKNPPMNTKFETAKNSKFNTIIDTISFYVDTDRPELEKFNVINADSKYRKDGKDEYIEVNSETAIVEFKVKDLIGIAKVEVIVDGVSKTYEGEDFGDDINNFVGEIKLTESKKQHEIIIRVTDLAGRVLDTSKKDEAKDNIIESYTDSVLVSTNFFVRFWNNKPVFWGVVGGTLGAAALVIILVALKKRKKKDEK